MKKLFLCFILLLTTFAIHDPTVAGDFSVYGSYWDTSDAEGVGGAGLAFGLPLGYIDPLDHPSYFSVQGRASYFADNGPGDLEVIPVEAILKFHFAPNSTFGNAYVGAGASYFVLDADGVTVQDEVGWTAVAGVTVPNKYGPSLLVEAQFRDNDATDVDLNGLTANVGVQWRW